MVFAIESMFVFLHNDCFHAKGPRQAEHKYDELGKDHKKEGPNQHAEGLLK